MALIDLRDVKKEFRVHIQEKGWLASVRSLFRRQYRIVKAVDGITFRIDRGIIPEPKTGTRGNLFPYHSPPGQNPGNGSPDNVAGQPRSVPGHKKTLQAGLKMFVGDNLR